MISIDPKLFIVEDLDGQTSQVYFSRVAEEVVEQMALFAEKKNFKLNLKKTKAMFFGNRLPDNPKLYLKYDGIEIETVKNFKLLGLWLDPKMNLNYHLQQIENKVYKRIFILRLLKKNQIPKESILVIYKSQIRSLIEYAMPFMFPILSMEQIKRMQRLQNICLKTIDTFEKSASKLHEDLKVEFLEKRFAKLTDTFIRKAKAEDFCEWFQQRNSLVYVTNLRNPRTIMETKSVSTAFFNSPVSFYQRRYNHLLSCGELNDKSPPSPTGPNVPPNLVSK